MFEFKGDRNYLHGTDFYLFSIDYANQSLPSGTYLSQLSFRKFARCQCELFIQNPELGTVVATGKFSLLDGKTLPLWWVESDTRVERRYEFDEDDLVAIAQITLAPTAISMPRPTGSYSCIEVLVALTKKLHNQVTPPAEGKWVFGQLNLKQNLPIEYEKAEVRLQSLLHDKFSVSEIWIDGEHIGQIRFIVGAP